MFCESLKNVLVNDLYNDLGFRVGSRLIILVEAQSSWSPNILIRALLYVATTYQKYIDERNLDVYSSNNNVTTGIAVAEARGVILLACAQRGLIPAEYTPMQVKQGVVGYGKAEKKQVMEMTRSLLGLKALPKPDDAADALAVALCHAHTSGSLLAGIK